MPDVATSPLLFLAASLAALALAPLLHRLARVHASMLAALDGFVLVTIGWLVLLHVIPASMEAAGWPAAVAALLGALGPGLAERWLHGAAHRVHAAALMLALVGVLIHTMLDGMALTAGSGAVSQASSWLLLAIGVVVHRIPVGLTIWMLLRRPYGRLVATGTLGLMMIGTLAGYGLGDLISAMASSNTLAVAQGFLGGMLLHVMLHKPHEDEHEHEHEHEHEPATSACCEEPSTPGCGAEETPASSCGCEDEAPASRWSVAAAIGALAGLGSVILLDHVLPHVGTEAHVHGGFGDTFWDLALESAPALVLGYTAAGLLAVLLPMASVAWLGRGSRVSQTVRGVLFGLPLPICSCGVIPLYRSLVLRGAPATAAMAFLVATPELGVDAILLSIPLLGGHIAVARVIAAAVVALVAGWFVGRIVDRAARVRLPDTSVGPPPRGLGAKLWAALVAGYGEIFSSTALWIIAGLVVAAIANPMLSSGWLADVPPAAQVPLFALLGMPAYICASGATPLVAVLIAQGVSPGAAVAFLLTGPATNITTFGVLSDLHGRRAAAAFAATVALVSVGLGYAVDAILGALSYSGVPWSSGDHAEHGPPLIQQVCIGILGAALLLALLRKGPRGLVAELSPSSGKAPSERRDDNAAGADCGCGDCH